MNLDDAGEKFLVKLFETFTRGVGALSRPWQIRREGRAKDDALAAEKAALAQAEIQIEKIRARELAYRNEKLIEPAKDPGDDSAFSPTESNEVQNLIFSAEDEADYLNLRRSINLRRIAIKAAEAAIDTPDEQVSDIPVDPDWFARWRNAAQDVGNEHMQWLWAKLLAGETKYPGSFSVQTLNLVAALSPEQANWIATIAPFLVKGWILKDDDFLAAHGVDLLAMLELNQLGVITGIENIGGLTHHATLQPISDDMCAAGFVTATKGLLITHAEPAPVLQIPIYIVMRAGRELMSLYPSEPNINYLYRLAMVAKDKGYEVSIGDAETLPNDMVNFSNLTII